MWQWLKSLFHRKQIRTAPAQAKRIWRPEDVIDPDPIRRQMIAECMNSGECIAGHVDENGNLVIDWRKKPE